MPFSPIVAPLSPPLSLIEMVIYWSLTGCPFKRSLAVRSPTIPPLAPLTILSEKSSATAEIEAASTVTSTDDDEQFAGFLSLIHISEYMRLGMISYAVFLMQKKIYIKLLK